MDKPFSENPNLLQHLSIVPTEELIGELYKRYEASVFLGFNNGPNKSGIVTSYYEGSNTILIGLLDSALQAHRNWSGTPYDEEN